MTATVIAHVQADGLACPGMWHDGPGAANLIAEVAGWEPGAGSGKPVLRLIEPVAEDADGRPLFRAEDLMVPWLRLWSGIPRCCGQSEYLPLSGWYRDVRVEGGEVTATAVGIYTCREGVAPSLTSRSQSDSLES